MIEHGIHKKLAPYLDRSLRQIESSCITTMQSPSGHRKPQRQDSAVSSASSGRTIRAGSSSGRTRTSSTSNSISATSIFARLTGRNTKRDVDYNDDEPSPPGSPTSGPTPETSYDRAEFLEAGPSDYWRRTPSPTSPFQSPPAVWRDLGSEPEPPDPWDGPNDEYRPVPPGFHMSLVDNDASSRTPPSDAEDAQAYADRVGHLGRARSRFNLMNGELRTQIQANDTKQSYFPQDERGGEDGLDGEGYVNGTTMRLADLGEEELGSHAAGVCYTSQENRELNSDNRRTTSQSVHLPRTPRATLIHSSTQGSSPQGLDLHICVRVVPS